MMLHYFCIKLAPTSSHHKNNNKYCAKNLIKNEGGHIASHKSPFPLGRDVMYGRPLISNGVWFLKSVLKHAVLKVMVFVSSQVK